MQGGNVPSILVLTCVEKYHGYTSRSTNLNKLRFFLQFLQFIFFGLQISYFKVRHFFYLSFLLNNLSYLGLNFAYIILFFTVQYLMNTLEHKTTPPFMDMSSNKRFLLFPPSYYIQRMCTTYQLY